MKVNDFSEALAKKAVTKQWVTEKVKQQQAHELRMGVIKWLSTDEEAKYYLGVVLGSATAVAGAIAEGSFRGPGAPTPEVPGTGGIYGDEPSPEPPQPPNPAWAWLLLGGPGGIAGLIASQQSLPGESPLGGGGPLGMVPNIMQLGGVGFAGFCASVLILKAIFSGTDLGELLSGVGEIVPL
jgi:hypothetical protein